LDTVGAMPIDVRTEVHATYKEVDYSKITFTDVQIADGAHRQFVGGRWDKLGRLQRNFLIARGLDPDHRLLDVGCGSLRAGRLLVDHLNPGNYYGIDINAAVLQAGYDHELTDTQRERLPASHLRATDRFDTDFGVRFDMAIAQSLFTHISLNQIRLCMYRVAKVMNPGGRFFATFFEAPPTRPVDAVHMRLYGERNGYWYYRSDMVRWVPRWGGWSARYIGRWGHPWNQRMVEYTKQ
jgi:SAM-dependent methyltransferase